MKNLSGQPEIAAEKNDLRDQLITWLHSIGDNLPNRPDTLLPAGTIIATGAQGP